MTALREGDGLSDYRVGPMDLSGLKTVSLQDRGGKVKQADFAQPYRAGSGIAGLIECLPHILAGDSVHVSCVMIARARNEASRCGLGIRRPRDQNVALRRF